MDSDRLPRVTRPNMADEIYELLKKRIIRSEFLPGSRLDLNEIEHQLGVSRTPLKYALALLTADGLVEIRPRQGTFVTQPTPADIAEAFDIRLLFELYAVELAIQRMTNEELRQVRATVEELGRVHDAFDERNLGQEYVRYMKLDYGFHRQLVQMSGNQRLLEMWEQINVHVQAARFRPLQVDTVIGTGHDEHEEIVEALERRDVVALKRVLRRHIGTSKHRLLTDLSRSHADEEKGKQRS